MNLLFVCSGNISRSFLADMLFKHEIRGQHRDDFSSASAGILGISGHPSDPRMVAYLSEKGIPVERHESRQISWEDVDWADLILVMEKEHKEVIGASWPEAEEKIELLGKYATNGPVVDDIVDPYRGSPYHYRLAQSQITLAIASLVKKLL